MNTSIYKSSNVAILMMSLHTVEMTTLTDIGHTYI